MCICKGSQEVIENCRISIEHSLGNGIYCEILGDRFLSRNDVSSIKKRMKQIIDRDEPFIKESVQLEEAIELFKKDKQFDKVRLLKYRKDPYINVYSWVGIEITFMAIWHRAPAS